MNEQTNSLLYSSQDQRSDSPEYLLRIDRKPDVGAHAFNASAQEAEADGNSASLELAWAKL